MSGSTPSLSSIAEANCLGVGFALSHDLFNATVECIALLFHRTQTQSDCCQGDCGNSGGCDLDAAVSEHRPLRAAALF